MGYVRHNAIVVTSWNGARIGLARAHAVALGMSVTEIIQTPVNVDYSFLVGPDGSKEGWEDSDVGDKRREQFRTWLRAQAYEDGSTPFAWVEVAYSSDDREAVVDHHAWAAQAPAAKERP